MTQSRLCDYLRHIAEACDRISVYTREYDQNRFLMDAMVQDAVVRNLEIIGEASRNVLRHVPDFAARHSDVPFLAAYEMRNALAHGYFSVDLDLVGQRLSMTCLRSAQKFWLC